MKVYIDRQKIFKEKSALDYSISTDPKVIRFRRYWDQEDGTYRTVFDVEFYCIVDQRAIIESDISRIDVYVTQKDLAEYDSPMPSPYSKIDPSDPLQVNNMTYDLVSILEGEGLNKFDDQVYLTTVEPQQNFNKFPARKSNINKLTDAQAFGTFTKYMVTPRRPPRPNIRRSASKTGDKYIDFFRNSSLFKPENISEQNEVPTAAAARSTFETEYRKLITQGIDPLSIFQKPDRVQGLTEFLKGNKTIDKCINHNHKLRKTVKDFAVEQARSEVETPYEVKKVEFTNRYSRLKTKLTMTLTELLSLKDTGENLIFYAIDGKNNKIDSSEHQFVIDEMLSDLFNRRPAYKFDASSSRNRAGFVSSTVQNHEKRFLNLNVYAKKIHNSESITQSTFDLVDGSVNLRPKERKLLLDGSDDKPSLIGPRFGTTTPVFHRYTADFKGEEIANTKSSYVGPVRSFNGSPTCSFFALISPDPENISINVHVTNISKDVMKVRVLKRTPGNSIRGQDFVNLVSENGKPSTYIILQRDHTLDKTYKFVDTDISPGVDYEYVVEMVNKSGVKTRTGTTFRERYEAPSDSVVVSFLEADSVGGSDDPEAEGDDFLNDTMVFAPTILIKTLETDVDKLLNSVFEEKHELFSDQFKEIKDSSNLIYGIRVHRLNKTLGIMQYVGSFTSRKTSPKDSNLEAKTQNHVVKFRDTVSPFYSYTYKIEPYILPPSHVMNRVDDLIQNVVKLNFKKSTTFGKYQSTVTRIKKSNPRKKAISEVGSKYASLRPSKGIISSNKTFLEKTGNDLFADGFTGDVIYHDLKSANSDYLTRADVVKKASIKKTTFYSRVSKSDRNRIRKSMVEIRMHVDNDDRFTDFYIIMKKENTQKELAIDGVIHSTDDPKPKKTYVYMSKCRGSIGAIQYFALPVFKNGVLGRLEPLGIYVSEE